MWIGNRAIYYNIQVPWQTFWRHHILSYYIAHPRLRLNSGLKRSNHYRPQRYLNVILIFQYFILLFLDNPLRINPHEANIHHQQVCLSEKHAHTHTHRHIPSIYIFVNFRLRKYLYRFASTWSAAHSAPQVVTRNAFLRRRHVIRAE